MLLLTLLSGWLAACLPPPPDSGYVVLREIHFSGHKKTRLNILRRELDFSEGDTLRQGEWLQRVELNRRKLYNTNLFVSVETQFDTAAAPLADVTFVLREQFYFTALPVFMLADRNFNEWWIERNHDFRRIIYGLEIQQSNIGGRAEQLKLNAGTGFSQYAELFFRKPYLDRRQRWGLTTGISFNSTRNLAYRTKGDKLVYLLSEQRLLQRFYADVILRRRSRFYDRQELELRYYHHQLADTIATINPRFFGGGSLMQRFAFAGYTYLYDFRDRVQYPLRGYLLGIQVNRYGLLPTDNFRQTELYLSAGRYLPLGGRWFVAFTARTKFSWPLQQPYLQSRALGYKGDLLRGYELYTIDGQAFGISRNTVRYQLLETSWEPRWLKQIKQFSKLPIEVYVNGFWDAGYVRNTAADYYQSRLSNRLLMGWGMGLDLVTAYNANFRVHYAFTNADSQGLRLTASREF